MLIAQSRRMPRSGLQRPFQTKSWLARPWFCDRSAAASLRQSWLVGGARRRLRAIGLARLAGGSGLDRRRRRRSRRGWRRWRFDFVGGHQRFLEILQPLAQPFAHFPELVRAEQQK